MIIPIFFNEFGETTMPDDFKPEFEIRLYRPIPFDSAIVSPEKAKFPKPTWLIESGPVEGSFSLSARRLLNLICSLSWDILRDEQSEYFFGAYASDMRRAIGQKTTSDNSQLERAIQQLVKTNIQFPGLGNLECPLLEEAHFEERRQILAWRFSEELREAIAANHWWGIIDMAESLKLTSKYALSLYELASMFYRRKYPVIIATPQQLRLYFGAGGSLHSWQAFKSKALLPAIKQLNENTKFTVSIETEKNRRTGAVSKVKLKVRLKIPKISN